MLKQLLYKGVQGVHFNKMARHKTAERFLKCLTILGYTLMELNQYLLIFNLFNVDNYTTILYLGMRLAFHKE